jgi:hypothetical protein
MKGEVTVDDCRSITIRKYIPYTLIATVALLCMVRTTPAADRPNIVMLMTDDTGWNDFGAYSGGGAGLGHPTPNIDRIAQGGGGLYQLVRPGELYRGPSLVLDGQASHPLGALDRGCPRRPQPAAQTNANHC